MTSKSYPSTLLSAKVALAHLFPGTLPLFLTPQSVLHTKARDIFVKFESAQNRPPKPPALRIKPCLIWLLAPLSPCPVHAMSQQSSPFLPHRYAKLRTHPRPLAHFLFCQHGYSRLFQAVLALEPFSSTLTQADFSGPVGRGPTEASFAFAGQI